MNRLAKIAASILIVAAIVAAIVLLTQTNGTATIAWADVGQVVNRARTICFTMTVDKGQAIQYSCRMMYTEPGLTRMEGEEFIFIADWANGKFLTLVPSSKSAHSGVVTELDNPYHKNWLDNLKTQIVGSNKTQELGARELAGRTVKGWRVEGKNATGTVWADAKTAELVQVEVEQEHEIFVMRDFEFNRELDTSLFSTELPEGYSYHSTTTMTASEPSVKDVAGLLRIWAMGCKDRFPEQLHSFEFPKIAERVDWSRIEGTDKELEDMISRAFWLLYGESGWKYVGAGVELGDASKPIFWHKPKGSERHKVIYGDLSIKELAQTDLPKSE